MRCWDFPLLNIIFKAEYYFSFIKLKFEVHAHALLFLSCKVNLTLYFENYLYPDPWLMI
jgi:hypothetical protein